MCFAVPRNNKKVKLLNNHNKREMNTKLHKNKRRSGRKVNFKSSWKMEPSECRNCTHLDVLHPRSNARLSIWHYVGVLELDITWRRRTLQKKRRKCVWLLLASVQLKTKRNSPFDSCHHLDRWMNPMSNRPIARNRLHLAGTESKRQEEDVNEVDQKRRERKGETRRILVIIDRWASQRERLTNKESFASLMDSLKNVDCWPTRRRQEKSYKVPSLCTFLLGFWFQSLWLQVQDSGCVRGVRRRVS